MKSCPFCYQDDLDDRATKCPHCAAWLDGRDTGQPDINALRRELLQELKEGRQDYQDYLKTIFNRVQYAASIILVLVIGASAWFGFRTDRSIDEIKSEITARIESEFHSQKVQDFMDEQIGTVVNQMSADLRTIGDDAKTEIETGAKEVKGKLDEANKMVEEIQRDLQPTRERLAQVEATAVKTNAAIVNAAQAPVERATLPVRPITTEQKEGIGAIPRLIKQRPDALSFDLGYGGYYGPAIWMYLDKLNRVPEFRHVVVNDGGNLFGVYDARALAAALDPPNAAELSQQYPLGSNRAPRDGTVPQWEEFAARLKSANGEARAWLAALPGFVSAKQAVPASADKREVLQRMEAGRRDWLPVVDQPGGRIVGVVDRANLTASLLLEIAKGVQPTQ